MLPPVAIVLNRRFRTPTDDGPFPVGASHFSLVAAHALAEAACFAGFILYHRTPGIQTPSLNRSHFLDYPALELNFDFGVKESLLRSTLQSALEQLSPSPPSSRTLDGLPPLLYHQTGVLLPYAPQDRGLVTHHGPFVSDVVRLLGKDRAQGAFRGGREKMIYLEQAQRAGLEVLRSSPGIYALEISAVQEKSLISQGIPTVRVLRAAPPVVVHSSESGEDDPPQQVEEFIDNASKGLLLLTAASRLDDFKNIRDLVDAASRLRGEGLDIFVLIAGDSHDRTTERDALKSRILHSQDEFFLFVERFPRKQMLNVFRRARGIGVFVFSSVFETFGMTPLEALCCGLTTVVPDLPRWIGVAEYIPSHLRFKPGVEGLTELLKCILQNRSLLQEGEWIAEKLRDLVGYRRFQQDLLRAVAIAGSVRSRHPVSPSSAPGRTCTPATHACVRSSKPPRTRSRR